jgi:hypothetical protein
MKIGKFANKKCIHMVLLHIQTFVSAQFIYLYAWDSLPVWWCPQMNKPCSLCTINADILKTCDDMVEIDGQMWHDAVATRGCECQLRCFSCL